MLGMALTLCYPQQQGSRLHQWKLPSLENDDNDFIRAPGAPGKQAMPSPNLTTSILPTSTKLVICQSHPSPNLS